MPQISVILPVYNGLPYLKESVNSVINQTLVDFEFIILDDYSTDTSWEYLRSLKDERIQLIRNDKNKGLFYNLNVLINKTNSPLIKLWSQDDIMKPDALAEIVQFHQLHSSIGFSYTSVGYIDENGRDILSAKDDPTPTVINKETHAKICFYTGSIAGNIANVTLVKSALQKVGLFNETMIISGDFEMWVRIAEYYDIGFLNKPLIQLRNHDGQLSRQAKYYIRHIEEDSIAYNKLFSYIPDTLRVIGKKELRKHKLVFYYTLMMHSFIRGRIIEGKAYWTAISRLDSPVILFYYFLSNKIRGNSKERKFLRL